VQTLYICASWETLGNLLPVLAFVQFDCLLQEFVFLALPVTLVVSILVLSWASLVNLWVLDLLAYDLISQVFKLLIEL